MHNCTAHVVQLVKPSEPTPLTQWVRLSLPDGKSARSSSGNNCDDGDYNDAAGNVDVPTIIEY